MTYKLFIGNKRYSSWSMRPWVVLKALDIPFEESLNIFKAGMRQPQFLAFSPSGKVPCLHDGDDIVVWDSLAIVEYLAERHEGVWPSSSNAAARAFARCAASEMHSSFDAIRDQCQMNVGLRIEMNKPLSDELQRDIARLSGLFEYGIETFGGPWLAGPNFTGADAFYAPIASRCKTYGLQLDNAVAQAYVDRLFDHPAVQAWVQAGVLESAREPLHEESCNKAGTVLEDLAK